jgi:four helix bundle protein
MNYEEWVKVVPVEITGDSLWKMEAYRLSLFAADLGWHDVTKLMGDRRTLDIAGQLYRALGSIEANLAEGYSRGTGRDRARFYEYALGSARESRGWFFKGRHILGGAVVGHRISLVTHIARLVLTMIPDQRATSSFLREEAAGYADEVWCSSSVTTEDVFSLLQTVPMP